MELPKTSTRIATKDSHASDRKFEEILQEHKHYKDMEFWVNSTSWRLTAPSEFLFSKLILNLFLVS